MVMTIAFRALLGLVENECSLFYVTLFQTMIDEDVGEGWGFGAMAKALKPAEEGEQVGLGSEQEGVGLGVGVGGWRGPPLPEAEQPDRLEQVLRRDNLGMESDAFLFQNAKSDDSSLRCWARPTVGLRWGPTTPC